MNCTTSAFTYGFFFAGQKDIGKNRSANQDEIILCPDIGVFAISDGMGGLQEGAKAAAYVREAIPAMMPFAFKEAGTPEEAGAAFAETVRMASDELFNTANTEMHIGFGAIFLRGMAVSKTKQYLRTLATAAVTCCPNTKRQSRR